MMELGTPAEWANGQKWKRRKTAIQAWFKAALLLFGCAAMIFALYRTDKFGSEVILVLSALIALAAGVGVIRLSTVARESWKRAGQARIGVKSERQVRSAVRQANPLVALYGVTFGKRTGDLDLTVVTRDLQILAVEVKTGFGKVTSYGNQLRAGGKLLPRDPVGQCARNAQRLETALDGRVVIPVVCIPGMTSRPFVVQGVVICSAKDLFTATRQITGPQFDDSDSAERIVSGLWKKHLSYA